LAIEIERERDAIIVFSDYRDGAILSISITTNNCGDSSGESKRKGKEAA